MSPVVCPLRASGRRRRRRSGSLGRPRRASPGLAGPHWASLGLSGRQIGPDSPRRPLMSCRTCPMSSFRASLFLFQPRAHANQTKLRRAKQSASLLASDVDTDHSKWTRQPDRADRPPSVSPDCLDVSSSSPSSLHGPSCLLCTCRHVQLSPSLFHFGRKLRRRLAELISANVQAIPTTPATSRGIKSDGEQEQFVQSGEVMIHIERCRSKQSPVSIKRR